MEKEIKFDGYLYVRRMEFEKAMSIVEGLENCEIETSEDRLEESGESAFSVVLYREVKDFDGLENINKDEFTESIMDEMELISKELGYTIEEDDFDVDNYHLKEV